MGKAPDVERVAAAEAAAVARMRLTEPRLWWAGAGCESLKPVQPVFDAPGVGD